MTSPYQGSCPSPFLDSSFFTDGGYVDSRLCRNLGSNLTCCLPCPMTDWVYPDTFNTIGVAAEWIAVISTICCVFLLLSWAVLPVEKTHRHYLSICLTFAVLLMSLGFVIPLAGHPEQCYDEITPNDMKTTPACGASGSFLILGGWAAVFWVFLRSLSLHLQICWQVVVGRSFMWFAQAVGWGIPIIGLVVSLVFSGVSFRFGTTCHINHENSLADLWIPLLVFAGVTIIIQFATFGYCIKVYLASLADNNASTENSNMPSYTNSIRTMTPKQAYRRVRRVIQLQWRGIAIVLIIVADVIFFSIIFVFQDNTIQAVQNDESIALPWIECILFNSKDDCLTQAGSMTVNMATVAAVLILLAMNGIWLVFLLGRWSMFTGWIDMFVTVPGRNKKEFVSVDARLDDFKKDTLTPVSPIAKFPFGRSPSVSHEAGAGAVGAHGITPDGRRTPDYFGNTTVTARYHAPARSFSSPRPPQSVTWEAPVETSHAPSHTHTHAHAHTKGDDDEDDDYVNPLGMNRI